MNKFEISSAFIIGHEIIDSEHRELVSILNDMVDHYLAEDVESCKKLWGEFCEKLKQHFENEMEIMTELGFKADNHEEGHERVLEQIYNLGNACEKLEDWANCLFAMRNDLLSWILRHDLGFAEYLDSIGYEKSAQLSR